jgi:hypothetical protein
MTRRIGLLAASALAALALAGCSGATTPPAAQPSPPGNPGGAIPTLNPGNAVPTIVIGNFNKTFSTAMGHLGDTLSFQTYGGNQVEGTLVKVFDPAVGTDQYIEPLPAGYHWVGVEVTLDNHSPDYGTEGSELSAVSSDGTVLTTDDVVKDESHILGDFQGCTQTQDGEQDVQPYTHCETFVVPDGQKLVSVSAKVGEIVTFDLENNLATWTIP